MKLSKTKCLKTVADFLKEIDENWTLFLDRDGVINKRIFGGYVKNIEEWEFKPGVIDAINILSSIFKYVIVVTNQQGVGKGLMTEADLQVVHNHFISEVKRAGGRIDAIYYCTKLASDENNCRKPSNFMALKAKADFQDIDFSKSVMLGDSKSDILFGKNSAMKTVLHLSEEKVDVEADMEVDSLISFAECLKTKI